MYPDKIEFSIYQPQHSASGDAEERKYKMFTGKSGKQWLVAVQPNAADNIYVDGGKGSQGMAGRTLTFILENGEKVDFIGPWKTGASELLKDTGQDYTQTYYTKGIVALSRENLPWPKGYIFSDILYMDENYVIGAFDRTAKIAQEFADKLGCKVYEASIGKGGGHSGWKDPKSKPEPKDE